MNTSNNELSPPGNDSDEFNADIIRDFLTKISFDLQSDLAARNTDLEAKVTEKLADLGMSTQDFQPIAYLLQTCCVYANVAHAVLPLDFKVFVAIYMILAAGVDDLFLDSPEIRTFTLKFGKGEPQGYPHLDCLVRLLTIEAPRFFGPLGVNFIISSTLDAINGFLIESKFPNGFPSSMRGFSSWMRAKAGYGEALTFFIFPESEFPEEEWVGRYIQAVPSIRDVICYINDILSFYKERVLSQENCLIANLAQENGCSSIASLRETCARTVALREAIRQRFAVEEPKLLAAFDSYITGYIKWHFSVKRYKLDQIGLTLGR